MWKEHGLQDHGGCAEGKGLKPEYEEAMRAQDIPDWYIGSCKKIKYMFPKAHAAAYVMQAIQFAWYKVHRPMEFYAAYFTAAPGGFDAEIVMKGKGYVERVIRELREKGKEATQKENESLDALLLVDECLARGIQFLPVNLYKSDARAFLPEEGRIRVPFNSLPGLGDTAAEKIARVREGGEISVNRSAGSRACFQSRLWKFWRTTAYWTICRKPISFRFFRYLRYFKGFSADKRHCIMLEFCRCLIKHVLCLSPLKGASILLCKATHNSERRMFLI